MKAHEKGIRSREKCRTPPQEQTFETEARVVAHVGCARSLHGCLFLKKQIPRDGLCVLLHDCRCALEAEASPVVRWRETHAKVTFGGGPIAVLERKHNSSQSRPSQCNPKANHHLKPARAAARGAFGREELSSWNPNDAQSPGDGVRS